DYYCLLFYSGAGFF
nr:immunoglobulin light chain junction region [Macaca mulatta]MOW69862.1 immunoglobulin light chain junction region [Macaca mulatta]MOW72056.1 immunoglobulin light chain junction region [Macaca mulatta]